MNSKYILISCALFFIGQLLVWFQLNGQFAWKWFDKNVFFLSLIGVPISYLFIIATKYVVAGFDGLLWPGRLLGFGLGMIIMAILTWYILGEGISTKTLVSLTLAVTLVMLQVLWK